MDHQRRSWRGKNPQMEMLHARVFRIKRSLLNLSWKYKLWNHFGAQKGKKKAKKCSFYLLEEGENRHQITPFPPAPLQRCFSRRECWCERRKVGVLFSSLLRAVSVPGRSATLSLCLSVCLSGCLFFLLGHPFVYSRRLLLQGSAWLTSGLFDRPSPPLLGPMTHPRLVQALAAA